MNDVIKFDKDANWRKEVSKALKRMCLLLTNHFNEDIAEGNVSCHFNIPSSLKAIFHYHYAMETGYLSGLCFGRANALDGGLAVSSRSEVALKHFLETYNDTSCKYVTFDTGNECIFFELDKTRCKVISCNVNGHTLCSKVFDKLVALGEIEPYQFFHSEGIDKIIKAQ